MRNYIPRRLPSKEEIRRFATRRNLLIGGVILVILIGLAIFLGNKSAGSVESAKLREVTVSTVAALGANTSPLPLVGSIHSTSEATLRTEKTGEVRGVYATVGQYVSAGTVIAEIENASERAAVAQAQAMYQKALAGTRSEQLSILQISKDNANEGLSGAISTAQTGLLSAYATVDSAIFQSTDPMFVNPRSPSPHFNIPTSDSSLVTRIENERGAMANILTRQDSMSGKTISADAIPGEINLTISELQTVKSYLDDVISALNKGIASSGLSQTTIDGYKTGATTARASVIASIASLSSARDTLSSKKAALEIAEKNLSQGVTGNQPEDIAAAEASLAVARANFEHSVIRTPISGTLNTLALRKGDFVNPFQIAAVVSNNGALEIVTYISEQERSMIAVGAKVVVDNKVSGVVTSIAPGLDPDTKKAEVRIGVTGKASDLTQGATVSLNIERKVVDTKAPKSDSALMLPLTAVKVGTSETSVFTVDQNGLVSSHAIVLGDIAGDKVLVTSGLTPEMEIVTDVRGLKVGDTVLIASSTISM